MKKVKAHEPAEGDQRKRRADEGLTVPSRTSRFTYSDEQWEAIKTSLAHAGIDDYSFMRRKLEMVGWFYLHASPSETPKQYARKMRKRLDVFDVAVAMLADDDDFDWKHYEDEDEAWIEFARRKEQMERTREELRELTVWIQERVNQLEVIGGRSKYNARKRPVRFWYELTHLWHEFVPKAASQPRKHLLRFLFACSKPVFSEATDNTKLIAFIERYLPDYVPQTSLISRALIAG